VSAIHIELVLGGLLTGALIGFFWPPSAALVAMLTAVAVSLRAS
jgi:hypothetical protein